MIKNQNDSINILNLKEDYSNVNNLSFDEKNSGNFITIREISQISGVSVKAVRRDVACGILDYIRKGNKILVFKNSFEKWIHKQNIQEDKSKQKDKNIKKEKKDIVNWIDISNEMETIDAWHNPEQINEFNFIDLYSGAGGLSCGLTMSGMNPIGIVEIMSQAVDTYNYNFNKMGFKEKYINQDIREESVKKELLDSVKSKHVHLIAGGFPCQGFSMAGNRIVTDDRNSLYLEMLDIVKRVKPDYVLMENVEGLRSMLNGKIEQKIIEDYKKIGYNINVTILNSADYGVAQIRRRVIFVGNRIGAKNYHPKPIYSEENYKTVADALTKYLNMPENKEINHIIAKTSDDMKKRLEAIPVGKSLYANYSDAWKKVDWNKPSCTVKENHGGVNVHPILNRVMTPRELAELQSFPEDFIFQGSKKWQLVQIGNAVPCLLGKAIGLAIQKSYEEYKDEQIHR